MAQRKPVQQQIPTKQDLRGRRMAGLYEKLVTAVKSASSKSGVKKVLRDGRDFLLSGAINEAEFNSLVRIGNRHMENIYEARGGVHTYKPQAAFSSRNVGI